MTSSSTTSSSSPSATALAVADDGGGGDGGGEGPSPLQSQGMWTPLLEKALLRMKERRGIGQPKPAKPQPEKARNALKEKHVGYPSREEEAGEVVGFSDSPARKLFDEMPQRGKGRRMSAGSDRSVEQSPLHPHHQYQQHGRSPRAGPGHGIIPHTPPRTRMRQGALPVLDREDSGSPVPRFGGWDEKDPATTENYTELFGNIRQERETSSARAPITDKKKSSHLNQPHYNNSHSKGCSCFGWLKN